MGSYKTYEHESFRSLVPHWGPVRGCRRSNRSAGRRPVPGEGTGMRVRVWVRRVLSVESPSLQLCPRSSGRSYTGLGGRGAVDENPGSPERLVGPYTSVETQSVRLLDLRRPRRGSRVKTSCRPFVNRGPKTSHVLSV